MTTQRLALIAMAGALLFPLLLVIVAAVQWDFLHDHGWRVRDHDGVTWPSGTALGPYGFLQVLNFLLLGIALLALAVTLRRTMTNERKIGAWLVGLMGIALLLSAFRIDQSSAFEEGSPETWNGVLHGIGFFLLLLSGLASMTALGIQLRNDPRWRSYAWVSFGAAAAWLIAFFGISAINGAVGFYIFLGVVLAWMFALASHASRLARGDVVVSH